MPLRIGFHGERDSNLTPAPTLTVQLQEEIQHDELHLIIMLWAHDTMLFNDPAAARHDLSQTRLLDAVRATIHHYGMHAIREHSRQGNRPARADELIDWENTAEHEFCDQFARDQLDRHWTYRTTGRAS